MSGKMAPFTLGEDSLEAILQRPRPLAVLRLCTLSCGEISTRRPALKCRWGISNHLTDQDIAIRFYVRQN
jgi:hypothetical protein